MWIFSMIESSTCCVKQKWRSLIVFSLALITLSTAQTISNQLLGIKYISFDNYEGTLANGECCDQPGETAGSCKPDMCDTEFRTCGSDNSSNFACNVIALQGTPATYNKNKIIFGNHIGNGINRTTSFIVIKFPFTKPINMDIYAREKPEEGKAGKEQAIADFHFVVDWVDPIYISHPKYRRQFLNNTRAQLVIDIVSQCSKNYYTEDCSVYCKSDKVHYKCLDNGTKECLPGWTGPQCLTMIDYCPGNKCQHGSTCVPIFLNYTCTCTPDYTGYYCETHVTTTTIMNIVDTNTTSDIPIHNVTTLAGSDQTSLSTTSTQQPLLSSTQAQTKSIAARDGDDVAVLASGVTVGVILACVIVVLLVYFIVKKKTLRSKVGIAEKSTSLDMENKQSKAISHEEVEGCRDAYSVRSQVGITENSTSLDMDNKQPTAIRDGEEDGGVDTFLQ